MFKKDRDFFTYDWVCTNPTVIWVLLHLTVLILCPEGFVVFDVPRICILCSLAFCHLFLQGESVEMSYMLNVGKKGGM